jgi:hypothetical protein
MKKTLPAGEKSVRKVVFESFGARIALECDSEALFEKALERAQKALLGHVRIIDKPEKSVIDFRFGLWVDDNGVLYFDQNGSRTSYDGPEFIFLKSFDAMVRLRVAENAVDRVFVHAGVIGWKGRALMVPAVSHKGKTTLVAELIQNGAEYYSDEYAVIDRSGRVHPFPRDLMMRGFEKEGTDTLVPPGQFGGRIGTKPIRVGVVLFTEYREGSKWDPTQLTVGQGIMETIPHTIPVHVDPKFSLEVLNKAYKGAIIAKSFRGDARSASREILGFLDKHII